MRARFGVGVVRLSLALLCATLLGAAVASASASAAVSHEYEAALSTKISEGPISGVNAMTSDSGHDSGHLWIAERVASGKKLGESHVDEFDEASGALLGQLSEEGGVSSLREDVAVGHPGAEEDVYLTAGHEGQNVIAVYGPSHKLQSEGIWSGAHTPATSFHVIRGLAVDNSSNLETHGDVYISSSTDLAKESVLDVFAGEAGGREPAAMLGQLKSWAKTGASCPAEDKEEEEENTTECHFVAIAAVAVSASGRVLVADGDPNNCAKGTRQCVIDEFEPVSGMPGVYEFHGTLSPPEPLKQVGHIAIDGEGNTYVVEVAANQVWQFDATGKFVTRILGTPEGPFKEARSVAADRTSNELYVGDFDEVQEIGKVDVFGPSVIVPDVTTSASAPGNVTVSAKGEIEARIKGTVNPLNEGEEGEASCQFVWGTSAAFGQVKPCPSTVPNGNAPAAVEATLKGLAPDTTYTFRLQASNHNGTNPGEVAQNESFTTPGPGIASESSADIAATSATLDASIDPHGAETSYYFQYGRSASYEAQIPLKAEAIGEGEEDVAASQHIQGLLAGTAYHYRVVAVSKLEIEGGKEALVSFAGPDQTFTTQGSAGAGILPDGRRWELVSPADKQGAVIESILVGGVIQAANNGSAISYLATNPTEEGTKGDLAGGIQLYGRREGGNWSSKDVTLPHKAPFGIPTGSGEEFRFFSSDLSEAIVDPMGEFTPPLGEATPQPSERTPYLRHDASCEASPGSCYQPLVVGCPAPGKACPAGIAAGANVPAGTQFGEEVEGGIFGAVTFVGASGDLAHAVLRSSVALTGAPSGGKAQLYESSPAKAPSQQLQLVSQPPGAKGEEAIAGEAGLGSAESKVARHAISEDGTRVYWSDSQGHLYLRDTSKAQTIELDAPSTACLEEEGCGEGQPAATFQLASTDGSRVLFTDTERLTSNSGKIKGEADLYECQIEEVAGKAQCKLSDLTPSPGPGQAADVLGSVIGASEDASWIYFAANGVLGDAGARGAGAGNCKNKGEKGEGQCNIYRYHEGETRLVARVAGADRPDWSAQGLNSLTARVSPNGQYLAFMSQLPLTGYDNTDAVSNKPDEEVYLYGAGTGNVTCASCNPTGARPIGFEYGANESGPVVGVQVWAKETWIAANVPGYTPYELNHALYQSRYLSNSGRLFFNTKDALVPQDINESQDVYEYEPAAVGNCTSASSTFHASVGGCVSLISSGRAAGESAFLDASETGNDVFFLTGESLSVKDTDVALDLYDAHACESASDCPEESATPLPCTTADACRPSPAPQPVIFGAPSSSSATGEGNLASPALAPPKPPPVLTRAQLLVKSLGTCRSKYKKQKKRRMSCEANARKRYGAKKASKSKKKAKKK